MDTPVKVEVRVLHSKDAPPQEATNPVEVTLIAESAPRKVRVAPPAPLLRPTIKSSAPR